MAENEKPSVSLGTLYDFNKTMVLKEKPLSKKRIEKKREELENWFNWQLDGYAMLLCRERYDFTVFHLYEKENPNPPKIASEELVELLKDRGTIISIEKQDDGNWEIWLNIDGEAFAYYLFSCDDWVIEC